MFHILIVMNHRLSWQFGWQLMMMNISWYPNILSLPFYQFFFNPLRFPMRFPSSHVEPHVFHLKRQGFSGEEFQSDDASAGCCLHHHGTRRWCHGWNWRWFCSWNQWVIWLKHVKTPVITWRIRFLFLLFTAVMTPLTVGGMNHQILCHYAQRGPCS